MPFFFFFFLTPLPSLLLSDAQLTPRLRRAELNTRGRRLLSLTLLVQKEKKNSNSRSSSSSSSNSTGEGDQFDYGVTSDLEMEPHYLDLHFRGGNLLGCINHQVQNIWLPTTPVGGGITIFWQEQKLRMMAAGWCTQSQMSYGKYLYVPVINPTVESLSSFSGVLVSVIEENKKIKIK